MFELIPFDRHTRSVNAFDPFRMLDEMDRRLTAAMPAASSFRTDVIDTGSTFRLESELPGFKKEDIKIDIEKERLTISAERSTENREEQENCIRRERFFGTFSRSFDISGINVEGIEAAYKDGILTVTLPKKSAEVPASRRLEIQ